MALRGISVRHRTHHIADKLNEKGVPIPSDYYYAKLGKRNSSGYVANLSGLIYRQDCGNKVRLAWNNTTNGSKKKPRKYLRHNYNCTSYMKFGKRYCPSHYIKMQDMDVIVLEDIRSLAQLVVEDEEKAKAEFLARKAKHHEEQYSVDAKKFTEGRYRLQELTREMCLVSRLMPMWMGSPVRSTSTTSYSMNPSRTREACFKAYLRYLSTIRKCVTIWQGDYR